jgi:hypothetical protein
MTDTIAPGDDRTVSSRSRDGLGKHEVLCGDFDRRSDFERRIVVNGVDARTDSISIVTSGYSPDQQKLHPAA